MKKIKTELLKLKKWNKIEEIVVSSDCDKMLALAKIANVDSSNFKNFEDRLSGYLAFHTATYKDEVVAMAGMYQSSQWHPKLIRICDRTYYFKKARMWQYNKDN